MVGLRWAGELSLCTAVDNDFDASTAFRHLESLQRLFQRKPMCHQFLGVDLLFPDQLQTQGPCVLVPEDSPARARNTQTGMKQR